MKPHKVRVGDEVYIANMQDVSIKRDVIAEITEEGQIVICNNQRFYHINCIHLTEEAAKTQLKIFIASMIRKWQEALDTLEVK